MLFQTKRGRIRTHIEPPDFATSNRTQNSIILLDGHLVDGHGYLKSDSQIKLNILCTTGILYTIKSNNWPENNCFKTLLLTLISCHFGDIFV